jgi:sarcosine oxidase/L-pipecolate oxidase
MKRRRKKGLIVDINKIIRAGDYADPALARMAIEAVDLWRLPEWEGTYHE